MVEQIWGIGDFLVTAAKKKKESAEELFYLSVCFHCYRFFFFYSLSREKVCMCTCMCMFSTPRNAKRRR